MPAMKTYSTKKTIPISVILRGKLKIPVPSAAAIIPKVAALNDDLGGGGNCCYYVLECREDSRSSLDRVDYWGC